MNQTLSRLLHPLSRDADTGESTGQYRGMLMRALAPTLTAPAIRRLPTTLEQTLQTLQTLTSPSGRAAFSPA
ncbi:hypothetical protein ABTZ59_12620 [Streptomyces sp. NPDC094034]|uniref:hypothetical protein n=1 Tax=Streptomyces sp. NPDC094034 TaxID=3155309 RepID=UPI003325BD56